MMNGLTSHESQVGHRRRILVSVAGGRDGVANRIGKVKQPQPTKASVGGGDTKVRSYAYQKRR